MTEGSPAKPVVTESATRRLLPLLRPYRRRVTFAVVISVFALAAQVANPIVVKHVIDDALKAHHRELLVPLGLIVLGLGVFQDLMWVVRRNALGSTALGVEYDLRNQLYAQLQRLHVGFHDGWQSGQLVSRAISDIGRIRRFLGFGLPWLILYSFLFAGVIAALVSTDPTLALASVLTAVPMAYLNHRFARKYRQITLESQDQQGDLTTIIEESAVGVRVIKAYGRMRERSRIFREQAELVMQTNLRGVDTRARFWSLNDSLLSLTVVVILLIGGAQVAAGTLSLGGLVAFISYQLMIVWPVRDIGWIIANAQEAFAAADRVWEILDTVPDVTDSETATEAHPVQGAISFRDVHFVYPGTRTPVLRGLSLDVRPRETLALVGMTGCGKTSVASLIARAYDPTSGSIALDGRDLRGITIDSLRSHVGVAFEDPILFSASVRENLLMGAPDAADDELWEALRVVQADGFVAELPWGLDTRVGEQGYSLSGGQRQRLALARAIAGSPEILVLDDPLSSVDVHTEAAIETSLRQILDGRTAVLIAHRPSTVALSDRVALLHQGRVVATGTHHDLLDTVPLYREVLAKDADDEREEVTA